MAKSKVIDKGIGANREGLFSRMRSFANWAKGNAGKSASDLTVLYTAKRGRGKGVEKKTQFTPALAAAVMVGFLLEGFRNGLVSQEELERKNLWDSTVDNGEGKEKGSPKVVGLPIAKAINIAGMLGCPATSLPSIKRVSTSAKSFADIDADVFLAELDTTKE